MTEFKSASGGKGFHMTIDQYVQRQREQGLLKHILHFMRDVKVNGGERTIHCEDPQNRGHDVEIIIRRVPYLNSKGLVGIDSPV